MKTTISSYLFILLILSTYPPQGKVSAQSNSIEDIVTAPNAIYVELLGQGVALTANYERILFATTPHNISLRAGFGIWVDIGKGGAVVPIGASYLFGHSHKIEVGIGYAFITGSNNYSIGVSTGVIGYRYQPIDGGFLIRVSFTPRFDDEVEPWVGLSLGYAF
jgi:hypothetical protein